MPTTQTRSNEIEDKGIATVDLADNAVTNDKMAQMATKTFKGNKETTTGNAEDIVMSDARAMLNIADGATANAKATGAELDTGTDDAKFATAKAIKDAHNVPSVVPSTTGNVLTSNGTDWISSTPTLAGLGGVPTTTTVNGHALSGNVSVTTTDLSLNNVDNTSDATKNAATVHLTNKILTQLEISYTGNNAAPTINLDNGHKVNITGQSNAITNMSTNLSGSLVSGDLVVFKITGTTAIAITWGAKFGATTIALPTTTVGTTMLRIGFEYNSANSLLECIAVA